MVLKVCAEINVKREKKLFILYFYREDRFQMLNGDF